MLSADSKIGISAEVIMKKIAVVYFSAGGVTHQLAQSLIQGIQKVSTFEAFACEVLGQDIVNGRYKNTEIFRRLKSVDAIVFASPTYMGSVAAQFKAFADASSEIWSAQQWAGKLAAGITCGSAINGEQNATLEYFITLANQHGMLWLGLDEAAQRDGIEINRFGCSLGVVAHAPNGNAHDKDRLTASYLGERLAKTLNQFQ